MFFVWVLLAIVLVLVALLAVPLEWTFTVQLDREQCEADSHIRWLFGLVRVRITGKPESDAKTRAKARKSDKQRAKRRRGSPLAAFSVEGFASRLLGLVKRLLAAIHIHNLNLNARLGLGDAAVTGRLWGVIGPLSVLLAQAKATRVYIEPDFYDEVLEFQSDGRIQVVPLQLVALVLGFVFSLNTLRAFRAFRRGAK
ncbi:DUF2953 domain-containing protein [Saccharospirillum impatiens]|uniref:DUF2953 domain-containing protein n=1 Tax=Saccharospirillum impatiens TaxID=169438 RepID=UPI00041D25B2|nr:DUF2953 domain-containing protein [Saccharospirillum impatiens]